MTPSLRELEQAFASAILDDAPSVIRHVNDGTFPAARHLQVYRHNTFANLTDALAAVYPVVRRLVGEPFFEQSADGFIRRHPPRSGNLHDFGATFADFLTAFPGADNLAYLPDVARLEWACHQAFHAAEAAPLALDALGAVPPDSYGALVFQLHPSSRLLASAYPMLRIWQVNQPGFDGDPTVNLDQGAERLLVVRAGITVEIEKLDAGEYTLLSAFSASRTLAAASDEAHAADARFDLMITLSRHVQSGALVGFQLNNV